MNRRQEAIAHVLRARRAYTAIRQATLAPQTRDPQILDRTASRTALAAAAAVYDDAIDDLTRTLAQEARAAALHSATAYDRAAQDYLTSPTPTNLQRLTDAAER